MHVIHDAQDSALFFGLVELQLIGNAKFFVNLHLRGFQKDASMCKTTVEKWQDWRALVDSNH